MTSQLVNNRGISRSKSNNNNHTEAQTDENGVADVDLLESMGGGDCSRNGRNKHHNLNNDTNNSQDGTNDFLACMTDSQFCASLDALLAGEDMMTMVSNLSMIPESANNSSHGDGISDVDNRGGRNKLNNSMRNADMPPPPPPQQMVQHGGSLISVGLGNPKYPSIASGAQIPQKQQQQQQQVQAVQPQAASQQPPMAQLQVASSAMNDPTSEYFQLDPALAAGLGAHYAFTGQQPSQLQQLQYQGLTMPNLTSYMSMNSTSSTIPTPSSSTTIAATASNISNGNTGMNSYNNDGPLIPAWLATALLQQQSQQQACQQNAAVSFMAASLLAAGSNNSKSGTGSTNAIVVSSKRSKRGSMKGTIPTLEQMDSSQAPATDLTASAAAVRASMKLSTRKSSCRGDSHSSITHKSISNASDLSGTKRRRDHSVGNSVTTSTVPAITTNVKEEVADVPSSSEGAISSTVTISTVAQAASDVDKTPTTAATVSASLASYLGSSSIFDPMVNNSTSSGNSVLMSEVSEDDEDRERRRQDRNVREQRRSHQITDQIGMLRHVLQSANIEFKPDKYSTLVRVVDYIQDLQSQSHDLEDEHRKLLDTISRTTELVNNQYVPVQSNGRNAVLLRRVGNGSQPDEGASASTGAHHQNTPLTVQGMIDYKAIFEGCPFACAVASIDGRFLDCNRDFEIISGFSRSELLPYHDGQAFETASSNGSASVTSHEASLSRPIGCLASAPKSETSAIITTTHVSSSQSVTSTTTASACTEGFEPARRNLSLFNVMTRADMERVFSVMGKMLTRPVQLSSASSKYKQSMKLSSKNDVDPEPAIEDCWIDRVALCRHTGDPLRLSISLVRTRHGRPRFFNCLLIPAE